MSSKSDSQIATVPKGLNQSNTGGDKSSLTFLKPTSNLIYQSLSAYKSSSSKVFSNKMLFGNVDGDPVNIGFAENTASDKSQKNYLT